MLLVGVKNRIKIKSSWKFLVISRRRYNFYNSGVKKRWNFKKGLKKRVKISKVEWSYAQKQAFGFEGFWGKCQKWRSRRPSLRTFQKSYPKTLWGREKGMEMPMKINFCSFVKFRLKFARKKYKIFSFRVKKWSKMSFLGRRSDFGVLGFWTFGGLKKGHFWSFLGHFGGSLEVLKRSWRPFDQVWTRNRGGMGVLKSVFWGP